MTMSLLQLLHRAATINKPYNAQDSLLLIKALSSLRLYRPEVHQVCEKAAFTLASSPSDVPLASLVDAVNGLCALQCVHFPVVQRVLLRRFSEFSIGTAPEGRASCCRTISAHPRTVHKAALVLAKAGRNERVTEAAEYVLRAVHTLLLVTPNDMGLRIGYVALYAHSSRFTAAPHWWAAATPLKKSGQTLVQSLLYLLRRAETYERASGNVAWQLLHLLVLLPPTPLSARPLLTPPLTEPIPMDLIRAFEAFAASGTFARRVGAGLYVEFLRTFAKEVCGVDLRRMNALLRPLVCPPEGGDPQRAFVRQLSVYEATRLASAVAATLALLPSHPLRKFPFVSKEIDDDEDAEPLFTNSTATPAAMVTPHSSASPDGTVWSETVHLCFETLHTLVLSELRRLSNHGSSGHTGDATVTPGLDPYYLTVLLQAFEKGHRLFRLVKQQSSRDDASTRSLPILLGFVSSLSEAPATMVSSMLRSIASLARSADNEAEARCLQESVSYLMRLYTCIPFPQRCVRSDIEFFHVYARILTASAGTLSFSGAAAPPTTTVFREDVGELKGSVQGIDAVLEGRRSLDCAAHTENSPEVTALPRFDCVAPILHDVAVRLTESGAAEKGGVKMEDADTLLSALVFFEMHRVVALSMERSEHAVSENRSLLCQLRELLAAFYLRKTTETDNASTSVSALRAIRLEVLSSLLHRCSSFEERVLTEAVPDAAVRSASQLLTKEPPTHACMSKVLFELEGVQRACAAARYPVSRSSVVLGNLCQRYQVEMEAIAQDPARREEAVRTVHILWRARHVGVRLNIKAIGGVIDSSAERDCDVLQALSPEGPQLCIPSALFDIDRLSNCAAADLLHLAADADVNGPGQEYVVQQLIPPFRRALLQRVWLTADVESVIRLVLANVNYRASLSLFPHRKDLEKLLECVDVSVKALLSSLAPIMGSDARSSANRAVQGQATRLVHALAISQLFVRLPIASTAVYEGLRKRIEALVQRVQSSSSEADQIALIKVQLLCSGALEA